MLKKYVPLLDVNKLSILYLTSCNTFCPATRPISENKLQNRNFNYVLFQLRTSLLKKIIQEQSSNDTLFRVMSYH